MSAPPGTESNLDAIFREHARYVWRCLRHLGIPDADAEDVCQEVFVTANRRLGDFQGRSSLRTWLYGIALRVASDYRRSAYVRRERATAEPEQAEDPRGGDAHAQAEARQALAALLAVLDAERRTVVVLYEIEGFTMKEVAELVGCPLQTAYSRLYSARTQLADAAKSRKAP
jgi:RNA polymerase sigma-70 factor (ECF subfamily)